MTVSLAMFIGAVVIGTSMPAQLRRLRTNNKVEPSILITAWLLSVVGVLAAAALGIILLLVPGHGVPGTLAAALNDCWSAVRHGMSPRLEELSGAIGALMLVALALRLLFIGWRLARQHARGRTERLAVLRLAARTEHGSPQILWLAHDQPLAFSMAGRPHYLVATEGLGRHLTGAQVDAVLEHERAHLRGRHHLLITFADVLGAGLPFLPLMREAPGALRELVEMAADAAAARRCGSENVRSALLRVTDSGAPGTSLAFGREAIQVRLQRLALAAQPASWAYRGLARGFAGSAPLLPFLTAAAFFVASSTLFCWGL